ncbi:hypothetical protein [Myxococcus xanthus]|uniref:Uncharacterized protein n=1 Tax=Myxococcus xanthus TaxID=34 RepID=A0A7Y4MRW5_MYXXA|nr:hypothetical protein [Myxococcus xanthus]NOJ79905.1 hypothetical protein [Myxococcus xanthus]NOJ86674.1 hypothetical protein [Myxococcus xanthus]
MREAENIWRGGTSDRARAVTRSNARRLRQQLDIIIRRYRGSLLGRLYQVRHATSGEPSLDLELTERQHQYQPDVGLELHISAHPASTLAPPRFSLRVHAPDGASDADVARNLEGTLALTKAMVQTACTRSNLADTMTHLRSPPRRRGPVLRSRRWLRRVRRAARRTWRSAGSATTVALALVAAALVGVYMVPPPPPEPPPGSVQTAAGPAGGFVLAAMTSDTLLFALELPSRPFEGQKTRACDPDQGEVFINGGCWVALEKKAPCGDKLYEHKGKCFRPAAKPAEAPRSISQ